MEKLMLGKPVADSITEKIKEEINTYKDQYGVPKLRIIRVGNKGSDLSYEKGIIKRMESCNIQWEVVELPEDVKEENLISTIDKANTEREVNGILLFSPLPKHLDEEKIKNTINPLKDVDSLNGANFAKLLMGNKEGFSPCTPTAAMAMLKHYNVEIEGKNAVVIGRSTVVGKPMALLLLEENATVTICHSRTKNIAEIASRGDIVVFAIGKAHFGDKSFIKEGAVVIDVGINVNEDGNLVGDVDTDSALEKASLVTPVPRGVGSVTTAILAQHVLKAFKKENDIK